MKQNKEKISTNVRPEFHNYTVLLNPTKYSAGKMSKTKFNITKCAMKEFGEIVSSSVTKGVSKQPAA